MPTILLAMGIRLTEPVDGKARPLCGGGDQDDD
jgi:hypothetical protein